MAARLILLCPGQGAQSPAMFDMARSDPQASALLDGWLADAGLADQLLGPALFTNRVAQPAIVAATLATWTALGELSPRPALVAGYSIGELAAHAVSGALDPGAAVRLAGERARLMDACRADGPPQAMVALSGLTVTHAEDILQPFGFHLAIVTGEDSFVAGGPAGQREALATRAIASGAHATMLPVEIASHTPFMSAAVAPFEALLRGQAWRTPDLPVLSGITAEQIDRGGLAITHLARQLAEPIRWKECMDAFAEFGVTVALELGPGAALSRMLQTRHPHIACRSVSEFRSLDGVRSWLNRHAD
ncbi:ACP S-malonyltransferase [Massilia sp. ST3]|uniref:ACP S-malonyltransferase n=1 Tax=Massilia sp. ST3 TaxID=2824903 RepID=UPI001B834471|nr:acyltransferase domain-containing protein [Massilia sp. ST3]MBQ5947891.1 acyltransferase domain-containing protein [Massilia sp. ST3]